MDYLLWESSRGCRNGDKYAGEYFGDKIHGFGVYHFANGHCYEGSWHEGKKQGFGMYTFRNGDTRCGDWDSGVLKSPLLAPDPAVQRAIQSRDRLYRSVEWVRRLRLTCGYYSAWDATLAGSRGWSMWSSFWRVRLTGYQGWSMWSSFWRSPSDVSWSGQTMTQSYRSVQIDRCDPHSSVSG
ncbi:hypothetical protein GW17_00011453 [Ensete ventricosum]|nr:hypothetical protein GW17_00011453 [Ensete ventricosum]